MSEMRDLLCAASPWAEPDGSRSVLKSIVAFLLLKDERKDVFYCVTLSILM